MSQNQVETVQANAWRERHYSKKLGIDHQVERIKGKLEDLAEQEAAALNSSLGLNGFPKLSLNGTLAPPLAEYRQTLYRWTGVQGEEPVLLYTLCFRALAEAKGWNKLEDGELVKILDAEGIPVKEFASLTEREIKVPEREAGKTEILAVDNIIVMPDRDPAAGRDVGAAQSSSIFTARDYIEAPSYFQALQALRQSYAKGECPNQPKIMINGREYVRPPTFEELLYAKVNDFHSKSNADGSAQEGEDPLRFFKVWLDSCTGRHYQGGTTKFKLIPICPQLITLSAESRLDYLNLPYADSDGKERDSSNGKYNTNLSRSEVLEHPDWLFLANENRQLLGEVFDIIKSAGGGDDNWKGMAFYINLDPQSDELRPLCVYGRNYRGNAYDRNFLHGHSRFLRRYIER